MTAVEVHRNESAALESVVIKGDLAQLTPAERVAYYRAVCDTVGLNPYTQPFQYITLSGKLTLYARKDATEQLRRRDQVSVRITARELLDQIGAYVVTAHASLPDGRVDEATGAVAVDGLRGEALANALMKAETKAKRRVTLSICGLGMLDETETDTVPGGHSVRVDVETGEIAPVAVTTAGLSKPTVPPPKAAVTRRPPPGAAAGTAGQPVFVRAIKNAALKYLVSTDDMNAISVELCGKPVDDIVDPGEANTVLAAMNRPPEGDEPF